MKVAYSVVFLVLALTLSVFGSDSYASIPPEGFPRFTNSVKVGVCEFDDGGLTITAENNGFGEFFFTLNDGGPRYEVQNGQFLLTAGLTGSNVRFREHRNQWYLWPEGLPGPLPGDRFNLFSADLGEADASQFISSSPSPSIGFRTLYNTFGGWAAQFAHGDESVYLTLSNPDPDSLLGLFGGLFDGTAETVTTVPLPAAFWLLASGVLPFIFWPDGARPSRQFEHRRNHSMLD